MQQLRFPFRPILTLSFLLMCTTAHLALADPITFTITGTFDSSSLSFPSNVPGLAAPFNNGNTFSIVFTIASLTPTPTSYITGPGYGPGYTVIPITGASYTNGSVTVTSQSPDDSVSLFIPYDQEPGDLLVNLFGLYVPDDLLQIGFDGPALFSGSIFAPVITPETLQLQAASDIDDDYLYLSNDTTVCCGTEYMVGNPTLVISPEPAPFVEVGLGLLLLTGIAHRRVARS